MDIQIFIYWILGFVLFMLIGAAFINGIFITTRGDKETRPDGQIIDTNEMIFYPFYKFIMKEREPTRVYYTGPRLKELYRKISRGLPIPQVDEVGERELYFHNGRSKDAIKIWQEQTVEFLADEDVKAEFDFGYTYPEGGVNQGIIRLYREYPNYRFSKYIRKPVVQCIKCMPSIWGTILFWCVELPVFGFHLVAIPVWILYCFCLSYTATFLFYRAK